MSVAEATQAAEWAEQIARGVPLTQIALENGVSRHTVRRVVGDVAGPYRPPRARRQVWVVPAWYENVIALAKHTFGLVNEHGELVGEGSPGKLLDEIGSGRIICQRVE